MRGRWVSDSHPALRVNISDVKVNKQRPYLFKDVRGELPIALGEGTAWCHSPWWCRASWASASWIVTLRHLCTPPTYKLWFQSLLPSCRRCSPILWSPHLPHSSFQAQALPLPSPICPPYLAITPCSSTVHWHLAQALTLSSAMFSRFLTLRSWPDLAPPWDFPCHGASGGVILQSHVRPVMQQEIYSSRSLFLW